MFGPLDRSRTLAHSPTPPEVLRPSGDVTAGVRFARDYHPRHLPPLTFLRPSAVYSSRQLVCLLSYRHHLGFKEHEQLVAFLAVLTGPSWGQSRPGSQGPDTLTTRRRPHGSAACTQQRPAPADETFASCNASKCHSPSQPQATDTGGGHIDMCDRANQPQVPDTITRCNDSTARTTTPPL